MAAAQNTSEVPADQCRVIAERLGMRPEAEETASAFLLRYDSVHGARDEMARTGTVGEQVRRLAERVLAQPWLKAPWGCAHAGLWDTSTVPCM